MQNPGSQEPLAARSSGVSPRAALVVLAVLMAAGGLYWLLAGTRPEVDVVNTGINEEATEVEIAPLLTEPEAKAEFNRLFAAATDAIRNGDRAALREVFTPNGSGMRRAQASIDRLRRFKVTDHSLFRTLGVALLKSETDALSIRVAQRYLPCFVSAAGRDITTGPDATKRIARWELVTIDGAWLIDGAKLASEHEVDGDHPNC